MALYVNTNVSSLNAQRQLMGSGNQLDQAFQRLSSGFRINSAADDAAGLQISNRLSSQINGLNQGNRNANDGISVAQTAEGAMDESTNILQRMRTLAIQSANDSNSADDRAALQKEVSNLQLELTRIAETSTFGGEKLLNGDFAGKSFQVGADANQTINITIGDISSNNIGSNRIDTAGSSVGASTQATTGNAGADYFDTASLTDTGDTVNIAGKDGDFDLDLATGQSVTDLATQVNDANIGVSAKTSVTTTLAGLSSSDQGTLSIGDETFTLAEYNGSAKELANAIGKAGYNASVNESGDIEITAENVDGVKVTGQQDGTSLSLGGTTADTTNGDVVVNSKLELESSDSFSITDNTTNSSVGEIFGATTSTLESVGGVDISSADGAQSAISVIDAAIGQIDSERADLGAVQNRFQATIRNQSNIAENLEGAKSRIKDADFAAETAKLTQAQILQQASQTILAQANQRPQAALQLLG
ncbi:flagellin [Idiomarina sp. X4]|uniref:flagellin n=1 Tax=Idiomarina sp. X4 TaxID=2055892 RepID=UPI000C289F1C|nr:flagellin [Idiomarina sp. X4]ATZ72531.1 flagellin [Idiomarina sp. X4]